MMRVGVESKPCQSWSPLKRRFINILATRNFKKLLIYDLKSDEGRILCIYKIVNIYCQTANSTASSFWLSSVQFLSGNKKRMMIALILHLQIKAGF